MSISSRVSSLIGIRAGVTHSSEVSLESGRGAGVTHSLLEFTSGFDASVDHEVASSSVELSKTVALAVVQLGNTNRSRLTGDLCVGPPW